MQEKDSITSINTLPPEAKDVFIRCESWKKILERCDFMDAYKKVSDLDNLTPAKDKILEAFSFFPPENTQIVIIGQDPYPTKGDACGLCFATLTGQIPKSLKNVYDNLIKHKLAKQGDLVNGDLRHWAIQGVLLINTALSNICGQTKAHSSIWSNFTKKLMRELDALEQKIHVFAWGGDAKKIATEFKKQIVHEWSHPSPMADANLKEESKFKNNDHFNVTKNIIEWNPRSTLMAWSDGACSGNGTDKAIASFASMIIGGAFKKTKIFGKVSPNRYLIDSSGTIMVDEKSSFIAPTNNRGEFLGIGYILSALVKCFFRGEIEIVSDSEYCVNTLEQWYPNRLVKGTQQELQNLDLIELCYNLLKQIRSTSIVNFVITKGHQTITDSTNDRDKCIIGGNIIVDDLAVSAKCLDDNKVKIESHLSILKK